MKSLLLAGVAAFTTLAAIPLATAPADAQYGGYRYDRYSAPDDDDDDYDRRAPRREHYERRRDSYDPPRRRDYDSHDRGGYRARGNYAQSCTDIEQQGPYLEASCRQIGGGYRRSRIDVRMCRSIGNNNGRLVCE